MSVLSLAHSIRVSGLVALVSLLAGVGAVPSSAFAAAAGTVDLLATPPELTTSVAPNLVLTHDDSGSMAWDYSPDKRPFDSGGWGNPYKCAGLIDPRITDPLNPRSWSMNGSYYNPNATYNPPIRANGTEFPNASFTAAWENGIRHNRPDDSSNSTLRNLGTRDFCNNSGTGWTSGAGYYRLKASVSLSVVDGTISNTGTLYTANNWEWIKVVGATQQQNFANWFSYYRTRQMAAITAVSRAFAPFDKNIRVAWQNINDSSARIDPGNTKIFPFEDSPQDQTRSKFYKWMFQNPASGGTPNQPAAVRVGEFFKEKSASSDTNPYWDRTLGRELSCRKNFHIQMTDGMWNGATAAVNPTDTTAIASLPDGRPYSASSNENKIIWNELGPTQRTMANIGFHYWATDLRPDFHANEQSKLKVRPYIPDRSTGVTGTTVLTPGANPLDNAEIYWNPANDPATWAHLVQFMIGFGVSGTIPTTDANYLKLRKGELAWPAISSGDNADKIDDMWHAAVNSRGQFFAAADPEALIVALQKIIASVIAQSSASTPESLSLPILTDGNSGYAAGYDTTDWSGTLKRNTLNPATGESIGVEWDAACKLSGGTWASGACALASPPPNRGNSRVIITSNGRPGTGKPFRWSNLSAAQQSALNVNPTTLNLAPGPAIVTPDGHGEKRVNYLRGDRNSEQLGATPRMRARSSLLGAVIKGEPVYVSSPISGHRDIFPVGSPERNAAESAAKSTYAKYQNEQRSRAPTVYVAANDGMLHAFNAQSGDERWAYVPNTLFGNYRLTKATELDGGLVPTVDDAPQQIDAFINGAWRTLLIGSLRLGGRGIYALDVTNPTGISESGAAAQTLPLWEFSNSSVGVTAPGSDCAAGSRFCSSLGYTYESVSVARIKHDDKWVALVSSGYFPTDVRDPASSEAAASRTSLLVIDLETGQLIKELKTSIAPQAMPAGFKTFGLSTPVVYDAGANQIDDYAVAGDLAGNLWRFDFGDEDPSNWKVDLMFTTYGSGGATIAGNQPIAVMPTALRDPETRQPIFVFGTGKYLGSEDRTSVIPQQAYYGIRDYGTAYAGYPIRVNQLATRKMTQAANEIRSVDTVPSNTQSQVSLGSRSGWRIPLDVAAEPGERAQRRAYPLFSSNQAVLYSLIPKSDDPCDPGNRYSLMFVNAATGLGKLDPAATTISSIVGFVTKSERPIGNPVSKIGGEGLRFPGIALETMPIAVKEIIEKILENADNAWHRGAWRELFDLR